MTIYEQIQKSVEWAEAQERPAQDEAAREAGMSVRSYTTWFWAVTGMTYREYVVRRRLERARQMLADTERLVIDVALDAGYSSHEAFSRAFRDEFGIPPAQFRKSRPALKGLEKIALIRELYMGIIIRELGEMPVACFEAFAPECERKAGVLLAAWKKAHPSKGKPRRVFGHNIDRKGNFGTEPVAEGYKFMVTLDDPAEAGEAKFGIIKAGKFLVTGIEGNFAGDPEGKWITAGWMRMRELIIEKGLRPHCSPRWFEEELEPATPGNLRLDLYLEIGE